MTSCRAMLLLTLAILSPVRPAIGAEPIEWQLAHYLPAEHFFATGWLTDWVRAIETETGGRLRIVVRPNNELLRLGAIAPGVRDGKAQAGFGPAPEGAAFSLVGLPFVADSAVHGARLLARLRAQGHLEAPLQGLHVVALHTNAPSIAHSKLRLVRVPADLAGQRMRGATPYIRDLLAALGATPVEGFLAPQVYGALRDSKVDGTVFPYEAMGVFRLAEQLRFHTEVPLFVSALGLFVDADALAALPPDLREIVLRRSGESASMAAAQAWDDEERRGREIARSLGNEIRVPSARELRVWREALRPFASARVAELGPDARRLERAVRAAASATRK
jgi:TRAP-type transport system periplasmic protein